MKKFSYLLTAVIAVSAVGSTVEAGSNFNRQAARRLVGNALAKGGKAANAASARLNKAAKASKKWAKAHKTGIGVGLAVVTAAATLAALHNHATVGTYMPGFVKNGNLEGAADAMISRYNDACGWMAEKSPFVWRSTYDVDTKTAHDTAQESLNACKAELKNSDNNAKFSDDIATFKLDQCYSMGNREARIHEAAQALADQNYQALEIRAFNAASDARIAAGNAAAAAQTANALLDTCTSDSGLVDQLLAGCAQDKIQADASAASALRCSKMLLTCDRDATAAATACDKRVSAIGLASIQSLCKEGFAISPDKGCIRNLPVDPVVAPVLKSEPSEPIVVSAGIPVIAAVPVTKAVISAVAPVASTCSSSFVAPKVCTNNPNVMPYQAPKPNFSILPLPKAVVDSKAVVPWTGQCPAN